MDQSHNQSHADFAMSEYSYREMSTVGGTRRDTIRFDELLYDDVNIAVTPSVLIVRRRRRYLCWNRTVEKEYSIQDIGKVSVGDGVKTEYRQRFKTRLCSMDLQVRKRSNVLLFAQYPEAAAQAIENAKQIFY